MISLNMLIVVGFVVALIWASPASAGKPCDMYNSTVADGFELHNTGCHLQVCRDGTVKKEKMCPEGFYLVRWGGPRTSCLRLLPKRMDFKSAIQACEDLSVGEAEVGKAKLVEAPSSDEYRQVLAFGDKFADTNVFEGVVDTSTETSYPQDKTGDSYFFRKRDEEEEKLIALDARQASLRVSVSDLTPCQRDFACATGNHCGTGPACDGITTCPDSSDEKYCFGSYEYWLGASNDASSTVVSWLSSNIKVKGAPTPSRDGLCLAVVDDKLQLFDCEFEGLYPMCEVCASNSKVDYSCEYDGKLIKDGELADRLECAKIRCVKGELVEEPSCPIGFTHMLFDTTEGCYFLHNKTYTLEEAKKKCNDTGFGLRRLSRYSTDAELEAITKFLVSQNATQDMVWLGYQDADASTYILNKEVKILAESEGEKGRPLCEACHTEAEQSDAEPTQEGCKYMKFTFEIGDQMKPEPENCAAFECVGKEDWEYKFYGEGCCEHENGNVIPEGPMEGDMPVAELEGDKCVKKACKDGTIIDEEIPCGCEGVNGDIYPHGHIISNNTSPSVCKKEVCEDGKINEHPLPPSVCVAPTGCKVGSKTIKVNAYTCKWTKKKQQKCSLGRCGSNGKISYVPRSGKKCKTSTAKKAGCK